MKIYYLEKKPKYLKWLRLVVLIIILLILIFTTGCEENIRKQPLSPTNYSYTLFYFKQTDLRFKKPGNILQEHPLFTFEYPTSFTHADTERNWNNELTTIFLFRDVEELGGVSILLGVGVHKPGFLGETDAKTAIELAIQRRKTDKYSEDFKIMDRNSTSILNIQAEYISYSWRNLAQPKLGIPAFNELTKNLVFDYKGFVWDIFMTSPEKYAPEIEVYFQHMLDTFRFVE